MSLAYAEYLQSPQWRELRTAALKRADNKCEYCGARAEHAHHIRYPKFGKRHGLDMLVAVCADCHDLSHGGRPMNALVSPERITIEGPFEEPVMLYQSNGLVWASVTQWCAILRAAPVVLAYMREFAAREVTHIQSDQGLLHAHCGGIEVFRWPVISGVLDRWYEHHLDPEVKHPWVKPPQGTKDWNEANAFRKTVRRIREWGYFLQEKELAGQIRKVAPVEHKAAGILTLDFFEEQFLKLTGVMKAEVVRLNGDVERIQTASPIFRERFAFVTSEERCLEWPVPSALIVDGRMNLAQAIGFRLGKRGTVSGERKRERLHGIGFIKEVGTWRRCDIDWQIGQYLPEVKAKLRKLFPEENWDTFPPLPYDPPH